MKTADLTAALLSWPLAYFYTAFVLFGGGANEPGYKTGTWLIFALLFVLAVELYECVYGRKATGESVFFAVCLTAQGLAVRLHGFHNDPLMVWQFLLYHLTAVYYILSRSGVLASGRTSCLIFLDGLAGIITIPWKNILLRAKSVAAAITGRPEKRGKIHAVTVISLVTAVAAGTFAWLQLSAADKNFAGIAVGFTDFLNRIARGIGEETFVYFLLSIPVGAWLFGLTAGSLKLNGAAPVTEDKFAADTAGFRRMPASAAAIPIVTLCIVYTVFFITQAEEFIGRIVSGTGYPGNRMPAPTASEFAVNGFWELLRILILNLCVLLIAGFLCEGGIMGNRKLKFVSAMLGTFGSAFAVLDAAKLYMYVHLYGYTVKRAVAAWCLAMLLIYTLLAIARIFRRFHAFPAAVFVSAVCFAVLCLINVEQCVNAGNIGRYRSGSDAQPDTGVLMECGIDDSLMGLGNTRELVNAGWCEGRAVWDLVPLWKNAVWTDKNGETADFSAAEGSGSYSISTKVHGSVLTLRFENGICTSADITSACGTWRM